MSRHFGNCKSNLTAGQIAIAVLGASSLLTTMPQGLLTQNRIALIWDFDKTLIPGHMQQPIFEHYNIDESRFWEETNALADHYTERGYSVRAESLPESFAHMRNGKLTGLNNCILKGLRIKIKFYEEAGVLSRAPRRDTLEPEYTISRNRSRTLHCQHGIGGNDPRQQDSPLRRGNLGMRVYRRPFASDFLNQDNSHWKPRWRSVKLG